MAGNSIIGALRVIIGADTASLETGLKVARGELAQFGASAAKFGAIAAAAFATATAGVGVAVKGAIDHADKLGKMAQSIGIPVEELSALEHAADLSGVSLDVLVKAVGKLGKSMTDAASKPTSEAANAFRALGVSVVGSDGKLKSTSAVLAQVAEKFAGLRDGAGKTALAMAIFGKAGADLIPLLNSGQAGLAGMILEARQLGLTITTDTAKAAEAFNDNLTRLDKVKDGIIVKLTAQMLPALEMFSQRMIDGAKESGGLNSIVTALAKVFEWFGRGVLLVVDNFRPLLKIAAAFAAGQIVTAAVTAIVAFVRLARAIQAAGLMMAAFEAIRGITLKGILLMAGVVALATGHFDKMVEVLGSIAGKINAAVPSEVAEGFKKIVQALGFDLSALSAELTNFSDKNKAAGKAQNELNTALFGGLNAVDQFINGKNKQIAALAAEAGAYNKSTLEADKAKIVAEGLAVAKANNIPVTEKLVASLNALGASYADANLKGNYLRQVFEQTRTPLEAYRTEIERLNLAFNNGKSDPDTYARAVAQAQDRLVQANIAAQALGQSLETAFGRALDGGMKFQQILRSLISDFTKALANAAFRQFLYGDAGRGGSSSGLLGALFGGFGGFRAAGGPVMPGMSYVVGESGPEVFTPSRAGSIVSNHDLASASAGGSLRVHIIPHDDKFAAYVEDGAGRVVARSTPQIVGTAVAQSNSQAPGAVGKYQNEHGGEYRV